MDRHLLKRMDTQKLESSVESTRELELLVKDGHHEVNGDRDPDLGLHCVGTGAEVVFDTQVAFDPFEKEFDLPSRLVDLGHGESRDLQVVGEEDELLGGLCIEVAHSAQRIREVGCCFGKRRTPNLIAENAFQAIPRQRAMTGEAEVALGPSDEEGSGKNDPSKTSKIHVGTIHHIESAGFEEQVVEPMNIGVETSGDIAQPFPPSQLRKGHADQLLTTPKMPNLALRIVALNQPVECLPMNEFEDLGEDVAARVHGRVSSKPAAQSSNASHPFWIANHSS